MPAEWARPLLAAALAMPKSYTFDSDHPIGRGVNRHTLDGGNSKFIICIRFIKYRIVPQVSMMKERPIGATELRQKLTDVIQAVKEENVVYLVETFGRPQVVVMGLDEYRRLQNAQPDRAETLTLARTAFGMWRDRDDIDDERLARVLEPWYSTWKESETGDE